MKHSEPSSYFFFSHLTLLADLIFVIFHKVQTNLLKTEKLYSADFIRVRPPSPSPRPTSFPKHLSSPSNQSSLPSTPSAPFRPPLPPIRPFPSPFPSRSILPPPAPAGLMCSA